MGKSKTQLVADAQATLQPSETQQTSAPAPDTQADTRKGILAGIKDAFLEFADSLGKVSANRLTLAPLFVDAWLKFRATFDAKVRKDSGSRIAFIRALDPTIPADRDTLKDEQGNVKREGYRDNKRYFAGQDLFKVGLPAAYETAGKRIADGKGSDADKDLIAQKPKTPSRKRTAKPTTKGQAISIDAILEILATDFEIGPKAFGKAIEAYTKAHPDKLPVAAGVAMVAEYTTLVRKLAAAPAA